MASQPAHFIPASYGDLICVGMSHSKAKQRAWAAVYVMAPLATISHLLLTRLCMIYDTSLAITIRRATQCALLHGVQPSAHYFMTCNPVRTTSWRRWQDIGPTCHRLYMQ